MSFGTTITGASGLFGTSWALERCHTDHTCLIIHERLPAIAWANYVRVDLESLESICKFIERERPCTLVHTVAITSVENCERFPVLAHKTNVKLTENVATACQEYGVKLVYISTDHLFDGTQTNMSEDAKLTPINVYGQTKAEAEERVAAICDDWLVIRTNFYGWGTPYRESFSDRIITTLRRGDPITLFDDVFYTPTLIRPLVQAIVSLLDRGCTGVYNVVGDDRISKYEFGQNIARIFKLDASLIRRGRIDNTAGLVQRPSDMSLSNEKLKLAIGESPGGVDSHLRALLTMETSRFNQANVK